MYTITFALILSQPGVPVSDDGPPPMVPGYVEPASGILTYAEAEKESLRTGRPMVVYVGVAAKLIDGKVVCAADSLRGYVAGDVVECAPVDDELHFTRYIRRGAQPVQAVPFAERDGSPWLSREETEAIKAMWPKGVPFGKNLRFYRQKAAFQYLQGLNGVPVREVRTYDGSHPWKVSGGMSHVDDSEWYNVRGFDLPDKIKVWKEYLFVGAPSSFRTERYRYKFPENTLAYDILLKRTKGKPDHIFLVRVHEKQSDKMYDWDAGTVYAPQVDISNARTHSWTWGFPKFGISAKATVHTVDRIDPQAAFAPTRHVVEDGGKFTPKGFLGAGVSCNTCHNQTGKIEHHGTHSNGDYSTLGRGDDGRFWHPFDESGKIDLRWPVEVQ